MLKLEAQTYLNEDLRYWIGVSTSWCYVIGAGKVGTKTSVVFFPKLLNLMIVSKGSSSR